MKLNKGEREIEFCLRGNRTQGSIVSSVSLHFIAALNISILVGQGVSSAIFFLFYSVDLCFCGGQTGIEYLVS